jgi:hypothetical protein
MCDFPRLRSRRALVALALLACAAALEHRSAVRAGGAQAALEAAFARRVDQARLLRTVRDLVAIGPRMGGTPSGDQAAAYLQKQFANLGLSSQIVDDAPLWGSWMEAWRVELAGSGGVIASAHPMLFSPTLDPPRDGPLILVPDLAVASVEPSWEDAVIYTPGPAGGSLYRRIAASIHRPVAIITSAPHSPARNIAWSRLGALPAGDGNPFPVFAVSYVDGKTLAGVAARAGRVNVSVVSRVRQAASRTVIATLRGTDPGRYYLVGAHGDSDSGGPGADDNASGVAAVLETARLLSEHTREGGLTPAVSVRFAIWGAEHHSARSYIEREQDALDRCVGVINFDQVGTGAEREAIYIEGNDVPWNAALLRLLERVGLDYLEQPGFWPEVTTTPAQGGTDADAFLPPAYNGRGYTNRQVPAVTIFTAAWDETRTLTQTPGWESAGWRLPGPVRVDYSLYYHSSADTPENTTEREPQNMVRAVKLAGIGLLRLLHH